MTQSLSVWVGTCLTNV